jgi:CRP/FNR family transcriptional regulator
MIQEDALNYLPRRPLQEFDRSRTIYDAGQSDGRLYVAVAGRVKLSCPANNGSQTVNWILRAEELFGESALVSDVRPPEVAVALDRTTVMSWTREEIEAQIEREPHLGIALLQHFAARSVELQQRLHNMAVYKTCVRVPLCLILLADRLGTQSSDGAMRVAALTHQTIADYVGTSREIVTSEMNRLRRSGMVRYSRKFIDVYAAALRESLRAQDVSVPGRAGENSQAA